MFRSESDQYTSVTRQLCNKVIVVGDPAVGKTSIIVRVMQGIFRENYKNTIGVDFALKRVHIDDDLTLPLQIWDVSGEEKCQRMTSVFFRDALASAIVIDVSNPDWRSQISIWSHLIEMHLDENGVRFPVLLVLNKIDLLPKLELTEEDCERAQRLVQEFELSGFVTTSAKTGENCSETLFKLANLSMSWCQFLREDSGNTKKGVFRIGERGEGRLSLTCNDDADETKRKRRGKCC